jgi:16S rRNA (guanine966-N2)-methyltransferase
MRVISGIRKGKQLKAVPGFNTRPTTDKVKEAIFNMIGPYFDGGMGLDLFAGSGGLGIEGLSRGLDKVIFIDQDAKAIHTVRTNLEICSFLEQAEIYKNDSIRALQILGKRELKFDVIWMDPPYKKKLLDNLLVTVQNKGLLKEDGVIVYEHDANDEIPEYVGDLHRVKQNHYGIIGISIFSYDLNKED